jgi:hypothetical protein
LIETEMVTAGSGAKGLRVYFIGRSNVVEYVLWTPLYLSVAPKIWLDHTAAVIDSSGFASLWTNLGTIGDSFSQSVVGRRPGIIANGLNGHRILRFDGTDDHLNNSAVTLMRNVPDGYCFSVLRKRSVSSAALQMAFNVHANFDGPNLYGVRFGLAVNNASAANRVTLYSRRLDNQSAASSVVDPNAVGTDWAMPMVVANWASNSGQVLMNGSLVATGTVAPASGNTANTNSVNPNRIGAGYGTGSSDSWFADIDLAAMIVSSDGLLPEPDRQRLEGYYAHEYALQPNLPADHPFKLYPPYVTTPTLQTNLGSAPAVIGFHAGTDSGQVGLAIGDAVASEFGVLLNSLPALSVGAGITVASAGGDITVRLDDITPPVTPALATIYDYRGETLASVTLSAGSGYYEGTVSGSLVDGRTYYVQITQA